jgi:hypothetical protein
MLLWIQGLFKRPSVYNNSELALRKRVNTLLDMYNGIQLVYLEEHLNKAFANPSALKLEPAVSNIVRAITDRLCLTFKDGVLVTAVNKNEQDSFDTMLDMVNFDSFLMTLEKYIFLCKTVFVKVGWNTENNRMTLNIIPPQYVEYNAKDSDPYSLESIIYPDVISAVNDSIMPTGTFHFWSENEYKLVNEKYVTVPNNGNPNNANPYSPVIPIMVFRESYPVYSDLIVWPGEELINAQLSINAKLTQLNALIKFQSFGVPVLRNPSKDMYGNVKIEVDVSKPIIIRDTKDEPGDFKFESPNANIAAVLDVIKQEAIRIFSLYGVDASDFVASGDAKSYQALRAENAKIDEYRSNTKRIYIPQIVELINRMVAVWNTHMDNKLTVDGVTLRLQNSRVNYPTNQEMMTEIDWRIKNNYMTPIEAMLILEDDMSAEEAEDKLNNNIEVNAMYNGDVPEEIDNDNKDEEGLPNKVGEDREVMAEDIPDQGRSAESNTTNEEVQKV